MHDHRREESANNIMHPGVVTVSTRRVCGASSVITPTAEVVLPARFDRVERVIILTVSIYAAVAACMVAAVLLIPFNPPIGGVVLAGMVASSVMLIRVLIRNIEVQP